MSLKTAAVRALESWLVHPALPIHLAALAMLLTLPAVGIGWQFDDHFHRVTMIGHEAVATPPLEVFSDLRRGPHVLREYIEMGLFPWWTPPDFRLAFFRYLSAASMWLDYRLWPGLPVVMHLHSLAWYGLLVVAATLLYRRLLGAGWWAGLAALCYAVDDAHVLPAAWLANRNALLATTFGILSLWSFDAARKHGSRRAAVMSPLWLGLGLCSGEAALAAVGYLAAYALFLDPARWRRRLAALTPHLTILAVWAIAYRALGFGTHGSDFYLDPIDQPAAFLSALAARAPVLLLGQWTPVPADWAVMVPSVAYPVFFIAGLVVAVLLGVLFAPLVRTRARAGFWLIGMLLALVPVSAVEPANRNLLFVGLGAMGLLAELVRGLREAHNWVPHRRAWLVPARGMVAGLMVSHLLLAPLVSPALAYTLKPLGDPMIEALSAVPDDPAIAEQDLVLVNPPDYLFLATPIGTLKILAGRPYPRRLRGLVSGTSPVEVTRTDERSLRIRTPDGIYGGALGRLFRSRRDPMHAGQRFDVGGMHVEIVRTDSAGAPLEFAFTFAVPLEDPSLRWLQWRGGGYEPFVPPPVGKSVSLPAAFGPMDRVREQWR